MTEPNLIDTTGAPTAPPLTDTAIAVLSMIAEARWLEGCALLCDLDPVGVHRSLRDRPALHQPQLHSMLMEKAYDAMPACDVVTFELGVTARHLADQDEWHARTPTAADFVAQAEAFRRNPGLFLPGAKPATGVSFFSRSHELDGWIELDGEVLPWMFATNGVNSMTAFEAANAVRGFQGLKRGLIVATHIRPGVTIPPELTFVPLAIDTQNTGPEAA